jgi:hypothetical protein
MSNAGLGDVRFVLMIVSAFLMGLFATLATAGLVPHIG